MLDTLFTYTEPSITETSRAVAVITTVTLNTIQHPIQYLPEVMEALRERMTEIVKARSPKTYAHHFFLKDTECRQNGCHVELSRNDLKRQIVRHNTKMELQDKVLSKNLTVQMFFRMEK